ncbi:DoxX family protein [Mesobacillus sp. AQ2]|jgi:putative oxidoreductase|uniref:DoxX family protein n=1 Tax=unclassified Mesobacillus TaxID=2675270 RepID=UPI00203C0565|nr:MULTISPECIES: DoxX family protein [unclassified Mesobacillus]MCM3125082.1 DoxX family protein [Mesobacillus sp. MER 33]MCM3235158.1 DoxX family protein [Mesobacillus sp. MER 48]WHX39911.1 DoxX family protein [Mesobacillus sp. AQ2]
MIKMNEVGATILRIVLGATFLIHGAAKFQGGIENTVGFFESLGLPGFSAYLVALIELVGGIAMILGVGTRIVSILFAVVLAVAVIKVKLAGGFLGNGQMAGYELDLALMAISIYLAITNKSLFAIDNVIFQTKNA